MPTVVSSQVSHVSHGVGEPEQFESVPFSEMKWSSRCALSLSTSVIVPPGAFLSYAVAGSPSTVPGRLSFESPSSWLRTIR